MASQGEGIGRSWVGGAAGPTARVGHKGVSLSGLTYPEVGATQGAALPEGYRHLRVTVPLGHGAAVWKAAAEAVLTWEMHRAAGVRMVSEAQRAGVGVTVRVSLGVGPLRLTGPCSVVWTVDEPNRAGFGYGTLLGHPEHGEESFVVEHDTSGAVRLVITAFSRPAVWYTRAAGPIVPIFQRAYARHCGRALRALAARQTQEGRAG